MFPFSFIDIFQFSIFFANIRPAAIFPKNIMHLFLYTRIYGTKNKFIYLTFLIISQIVIAIIYTVILIIDNGKITTAQYFLLLSINDLYCNSGCRILGDEYGVPFTASLNASMNPCFTIISLLLYISPQRWIIKL